VEDEDQKFNMVHPNPFIDDEAEEDPDYGDSSDKHSHYDKDEIDYYLQRTENDSNTDSAEPIQDFTISLTEYSPVSPYLNRSSSTNWPLQSPDWEPHSPVSPPFSPSPSEHPTGLPFLPTPNPLLKNNFE
jgi:hypothetical protein